MKKTPIISGIFRNLFLTQLMIQLIGIIGNVVNGMVIGKFLGENAMASFSFTSSVSLTVAITASVLSMGNSMVCSKRLGEGKQEQTRHAFSACFTAALITAAMLSLLIFLFADQIARITGAEGESLSLTADYIQGYAIAGPGIILVSFLMPVLQMDGEMKRLLLTVIIMTAANIAADLVNVTVIHGGMFGMAAAAAVSYYLALLLLLPHFLKKVIIFTLPRLTFDKKITARMFTGGSANAAGQCGRLVLTFILNRLLMRDFGTAAVAANSVIISIGYLCLVPGSAICDTTQILAGVLCGEEDRTGIVQMMETGLRYCLFVNIFGIALFQFTARPLVCMFFSGATDTLDLSVTGFRFFVLCMPFYSVNGLYRCFCQGSGQFRAAFLITVLDCPVFPLAAALLLEFNAGVPAVWLCYCIGEGILMILIFHFFKKRDSDVKGVASVTPFTDGFGSDIEALLECSIDQKDMFRVEEMSRNAGAFCRENGADARTVFLMSLFVEEAAGNVVEYGFRDGRPHHIDLRILRKKDGWTLRLRDNCPLFDPARYLEQFSDPDPCACIGLKLIRNASKSMTYLNTLNLNNLIVTL